jgi:hypothetical protein
MGTGRQAAGGARALRQSFLETLKRPVRRLRADYRRLTGPLRGLPSVLIIGAQKSGTTSLYQYLVEHPNIVPPLTKEAHFFDLHYGRGVSWYRGCFPYSHLLRGGSLTLDASPYYLVHPLAPSRAAALLPQVKLIAILRNPVDRALSHYHHEVRKGREPLSFAEAIERESERLAGEEDRLMCEPTYYSYSHHRHSYIRRGHYLEQLRGWAQYFRREQLLVLQSEALFGDPGKVLSVVHDFLELRSHQLEHYSPFLTGNYAPGMLVELRTRLSGYFEPHNQELYRWLGQAFDWR